MALGAIAIGAQVTGTLLNAYSQYSAYQEQKATTKYNQAILDANKRIDDSITALNIKRIQDEGKELLGAQRASMAKSGTTFSGSNLAVFMDTIKDIEMDVQMLEIEKMARGFGVEQQKSELSRNLSISGRALPLQIASSLLTGTSSILSNQSTNIANKVK